MSETPRKSKRSAALIATGVGVAFVIGSAGGAYAGHKIHTHDIAKHAVTYNKLSNGLQHKVDKHVRGPQGKQGPQGVKGDDGLAGAVYRVENYENGGGGDATVACADNEADSQKYTAIAGGVQAGHVGTNDFAVAASFPGRMNWDTNEPKANRLDGWIVLGNGVHTDNLKIWALCVPNTDIPVQTVNLDN